MWPTGFSRARARVCVCVCVCVCVTEREEGVWCGVYVLSMQEVNIAYKYVRSK